jgi:hypothetical protein
LYLVGTDVTQTNYFYLNGGWIDTSTATAGSGGVAYMNGLSEHKFIAAVTNTIQPTIKTVTSR